MKIWRLSYGLVVALSLVAVACGGDAPPAENPPPPPPPSAAPTDAPAASTDVAPPPPPAADTGKASEPPPPPAKPNKDKFVGKWLQDFSGDVQAAAAEAAKKAGGAKADQKKIDAAMKKAQDGFKPASIEVADGMQSWIAGGKPVHKYKFDVTKDDGATLAIKANGKDEVTKKDSKDEAVFTFSDDNTITVKNPDPKDKKGMMLVFKRQ